VSFHPRNNAGENDVRSNHLFSEPSLEGSGR
jgi:hypothetical protein